MGFRMRKSIRLAPGIRINFSKSGIGYSAGVKGYRVTQRADGRVQRTVSIPGTGLSHVSTSGSVRRPSPSGRRSQPPPAVRPAKPELFAPKGEKELFGAIETQNVVQMEAVMQRYPEYALPAAAIAGLLKLSSGDGTRAA